MEDFKGWELKALWEDFQYGLKINENVEYIAIVGDKKWMEWATKLGKTFAKGKVKFFEPDKSEDAWYWLRTANALEMAN
jgi:hypothetical protein